MSNFLHDATFLVTYSYFFINSLRDSLAHVNHRSFSSKMGLSQETGLIGLVSVSCDRGGDMLYAAAFYQFFFTHEYKKVVQHSVSYLELNNFLWRH